MPPATEQAREHVLRHDWTRDEVVAAFRLYCLLPFGLLHSRNPSVIQLAQALGRTPSAVAMKLVNLASLDPDIRGSGRAGLANASKLDRAVWEAFHRDWEVMEGESEAVFLSRGLRDPVEEASLADPLPVPQGETTRERLIQGRVGQGFFRKAVLASYGYVCCMSGLRGSSLLLASHIKPWAEDREHRLNPSNGLCLSPLHDRAFDQGLLSVGPDYRIRVSPRLRAREPDPLARTWLLDLEGRAIATPHRFLPDRDLLDWHGKHRFQAS